jgi:hypothetical protein
MSAQESRRYRSPRVRSRGAAEDDLPNVASPLATEDFVVTGDASGMVNCYDIGTGRKLWTHEFDESFLSFADPRGRPASTQWTTPARCTSFRRRRRLSPSRMQDWERSPWRHRHLPAAGYSSAAGRTCTVLGPKGRDRQGIGFLPARGKVPKLELGNQERFKVQFPMAKSARLGRWSRPPNWRNLDLEPWILNLACSQAGAWEPGARLRSAACRAARPPDIPQSDSSFGRHATDTRSAMLSRSLTSIREVCADWQNAILWQRTFARPRFS